MMHGFTYSGHPVGGAIGLANLEIMENEGLVENAARVGPYLLRRLHEAVGDHPYVGDVRGVGLISAVEFMADKERRRPFDPAANVHRIVAAKALEQGVMLRPLPFIEVIPSRRPVPDRGRLRRGGGRVRPRPRGGNPELHRLAGEGPNRR